jgi:translocation and assembly module TamB
VASAIAGLEPDTTGRRTRLDGVADGKVVLSGALDSLMVAVEGGLSDLRWAGTRAARVSGAMTWQGGSRPELTLRAGVDSSVIAGLKYAALSLDAAGPVDSLALAARAQGPNGLDLRAEGVYRDDGGQALTVRDFAMALRGNRWRLIEPFTAGIRDSVITLSPTRLERADGAATIVAEGMVPGRSAGALDLRAFGLDLRDLYALAQRDTSGVGGVVTADARLSGTALAPVLRGTAALTGPVFGDFRAPLVQTAFFYRDERLQADLKFWRTGVPVIEVAAGLPLDLAWQRTRKGGRQLAGPLAIRARADSMDLALLEAFTRNLRRMRGSMDMDVTVGGTWETPRLGGTVAISGGGATVPSLGVRYGPVNGRFVLAGDSILVDSLRINGERGGANITGQVRLDRLTRPILELDMRARGFSVMDVPGFLTLELDADAQFRGPLVQPVLTGRGTVRNTVLYFADLVSKSIVNLEDPLYADLVDTLALREGGLRAEFQSRFLDSLTIRDLSFRAAEGVWLRSSEANIQLEGQANVNKVRQIYRLDGTFNAVRGTYTLRVGPISRAFEVTRGVVRYLGEPDLNADLDVEARHVIKAASAEASARDLEITAKIGGTLRTPRLALESSIRPPLSQSDIISLLLLGQTVNSQVASPAQTDRFAQALSLLAGTLTSEIERSIMQGNRSQAAPDLIEIRPGLGYGAVAGGASLTRLSAGWNLGTRWFVSINAGFCPGFQQFDFRNFGASLDYQFNRSTSFSISGEPVQTCLAGAAGGISSKRYQLGGDLQWQREY